MTSWKLTENFAKLSKCCFSKSRSWFVYIQFLITISSPWTPWSKVSIDIPRISTFYFRVQTHYTADDEYHCLVLLPSVKNGSSPFGGNVTYVLHFTRITIRIILIRTQRNLNWSVSQASWITDVDFTLVASHSHRLLHIHTVCFTFTPFASHSRRLLHIHTVHRISVVTFRTVLLSHIKSNLYRRLVLLAHCNKIESCIKYFLKTQPLVSKLEVKTKIDPFFRPLVVIKQKLVIPKIVAPVFKTGIEN